MKHILFLGIRPGKISTVEETMMSAGGEWRALVPPSIPEAINWINRIQIDVVVAQIQQTDYSIVDMLSQIQKYNPKIIRIAITDQQNIVDHLRKASLAQQFISPSFDKNLLKTSIERGLSLGNLVQNNLFQKLVSQIQYLPSLPNLYLQIADELNCPNPSASRVGEIISQDLSMSAKVLQIVNSAHFGLPYLVANPVQATTLLGLETIRDLVLSIKVFSNFDQMKIRQLGLTRLWNHSIVVGTFSKQIAKQACSDKHVINNSFTAGLLHDIGKLILAENLPMKYQSAMVTASQKRMELCEAETQILGANHGQVGAYLLWLWNLPEPVVTATAYHHEPIHNPKKEITPLTNVHLANVFSYEKNTLPIKWRVSSLSEEYLKQIKPPIQIDHLRSICERDNQVDPIGI